MSTSNDDHVTDHVVTAIPHARPTNNIVNTLTGGGDFTTLVNAIKTAGVAESLARNGPFTMFAPTDAAFKKLPGGALNALLKDTAKLKAILSYHIVQGHVALKYLKSGEVATMQGSSFTVTLTAPVVMVNAATVEKFDLTATNGVIHVIDAVLLPKNWRLPTH